MAAWLITSRLSPFSSSLLNQSPPTLPPLPTLAELRKHAEDLKSTVSHNLPQLPSHWFPVENMKSPPPAVSISHSVRQPIRPWGVPPSYALHDPMEEKREIGKLKKGHEGWKRLQDGLPGEEEPQVSKRSGSGKGQSGGEDGEGVKRRWWEW